VQLGKRLGRRRRKSPIPRPSSAGIERASTPTWARFENTLAAASQAYSTAQAWRDDRAVKERLRRPARTRSHFLLSS